MRWRELLAELDASVGAGDARILVEEAAELRFAELYPLLSEPAPPPAVARARMLAARRRAGEPLQHVVGHWSFRHLELLVDGRALVPRPETEVVVGRALDELARLHTAGRPQLALDLGTGSGAIALSLALELPALEVIATDASLAALALAAENRARLGDAASRVRLVAGDWYRPLGAALAGRLDLIVANPPYLTPAEWRAADAVVRDHDPPAALVGGESGLEAIAAVVGGAARFLAPGAALVVEIGSGQGAASRGLAAGAGATLVEIAPDYVGRDRMLVARW